MIENDLNGLGYYRVAPVSCFSDLITLTHYSPDPFERFDLVVINAELVTAAGVKALDFCLENARLRHALIYDSALQRRFPRTFNQSPSQQVRLIHKIDRTQLVDFLSLIDPSFDLLSVDSC
ncbi:hypothetical protein ACIOVF_27600 [Pseudomonas sp. NPDC087612]|uniref:hypothetical protein n=1 Tax=Pseudomonas sp. NPDC087612 TaxID=3364441 RepID=UPI0037F429FD